MPRLNNPTIYRVTIDVDVTERQMRMLLARLRMLKIPFNVLQSIEEEDGEESDG